MEEVKALRYDMILFLKCSSVNVLPTDREINVCNLNMFPVRIGSVTIVTEIGDKCYSA